MNCFDKLHAVCQWSPKIVTSSIQLIISLLRDNMAVATAPRFQKYTISHRLFPAPYVLWEPQATLAGMLRSARALITLSLPRAFHPMSNADASSRSTSPERTPAIPKRGLPARG